MLKDEGEIDAAILAYRQAVAIDPYNAGIHSNLLCVLHYHAACDARAIAAEHSCWNLAHGEPLKRHIQPHANDRHPERRLRVGYVSPDFRNHAVAPMVLPLLASHDRGQVEVFCYAQVERPDAMTEQCRAQADQWRSTVGLSDEQMAALIREDRIDILVELAGHTAGHRLLVLVRKPAPVQINRQGYPGATGLTAMDYRMTDAHADPPGVTEAWHSEELIRLPVTNWIYQPPGDCPPPDHAAAGGPVTFGCFNNFAKVTEPMLRVWARILAAVSGSRLLLKSLCMDAPDVQRRIRGMFQEEHIAGERVELVGRRHSEREHLALYNQMDIALDRMALPQAISDGISKR